MPLIKSAHFEQRSLLLASAGLKGKSFIRSFNSYTVSRQTRLTEFLRFYFYAQARTSRYRRSLEATPHGIPPQSRRRALTTHTHREPFLEKQTATSPPPNTRRIIRKKIRKTARSQTRVPWEPAGLLKPTTVGFRGGGAKIRRRNVYTSRFTPKLTVRWNLQVLVQPVTHLSFAT